MKEFIVLDTVCDLLGENECGKKLILSKYHALWYADAIARCLPFLVVCTDGHENVFMPKGNKYGAVFLKAKAYAANVVKVMGKDTSAIAIGVGAKAVAAGGVSVGGSVAGDINTGGN